MLFGYLQRLFVYLHQFDIYRGLERVRNALSNDNVGESYPGHSKAKVTGDLNCTVACCRLSV